MAFVEDADHCHGRKGWFPFLEGCSQSSNLKVPIFYVKQYPSHRSHYVENERGRWRQSEIKESGKCLLEGFWRAGKGAAQGSTEWGISTRVHVRLVGKNSQSFQAALLCDFHHWHSRRTWMLWFTQGLGFTQISSESLNHGLGTLSSAER